MAERKRHWPALAALLFATAVQGAGLDDWSWEDGLLGDSIEGDVFESPAGEYPGFLCDACRDPGEYLIDFAALAYNGWWGETPWMRETRIGMPFRIYNLELQWVAVWFEEILFDMPSLYPNTLEVRLRLETGEIVTITVLQDGPDLPVGSTEPDEADVPIACSCGGDSDAGEADEDYTEPDDTEVPEVERDGYVEIVDPDADGEFPPWEEEL